MPEIERLSFNPAEVLQACTSAYMFALGAFFYYKYPYMVNTNP
jgi:hypothetical protein